MEPFLDTRVLFGRHAYLPMRHLLLLLLLTLLRKLSISWAYSLNSNICAYRRVWDTHTGETLTTIQHNHIVRAVAFPPNNGHLLATGGFEKKLRIFDLSSVAPVHNQNGDSQNNSDSSDPTLISADKGFEIGPGVHEGPIKAIIWTHDPNVLVTTCDDNVVRWWDLQQRKVIQELPVKGNFGSVEFNTLQTGASETDIGGGYPVLAIAAGSKIYFYGGHDARNFIKEVEMPYPVASVAVHPKQGKYVVGGHNDTWAKVYDFETGEEMGKLSARD